MNTSAHFDKVLFPTVKGRLFIRSSEISYIEADDVYCFLHTIENKRFLILKTLKWVGELLKPEHFYRSHHSFIVNVHSIRMYDKGEHGLVMDCGQVVPVSRRKRSGLLISSRRANKTS